MPFYSKTNYIFFLCNATLVFSGTYSGVQNFYENTCRVKVGLRNEDIINLEHLARKDGRPM